MIPTKFQECRSIPDRTQRGLLGIHEPRVRRRAWDVLPEVAACPVRRFFPECQVRNAA